MNTPEHQKDSPEYLGDIIPRVEQLALSQEEYIRSLERSVQLLQREIEHLRQTPRNKPGRARDEILLSTDSQSVAHTAQLIRSYSTPEQVVASLRNYVESRFPIIDSAMLLYEAGGKLSPAADTTTERLITVSRNIEEEGIIDWAFTHKRTFVLPNLREQDESNIILVPLFLRGAPVGIFVALTTLSAQDFDKNTLHGMTVLAESAAIAVDNIRSANEISDMNLRLGTLNQQMIRSAKLASIGELAGSIAHEINNPLQILIGHFHLLESGVGDSSRRISIIKEQIARISEITRRLLTFGRSIPSDNTPAPLKLADSIDNVLQFVGSQLQRDGIELEKEFEQSDFMVRGIRSQLEQVLLNIILNARDAMPEGGKLTIAIFRENTHFVSLSIADNGVGIEADDVDKIFESYFTTKPPGKGTGLGLSISREIIRQHNGRISVASEPGRGTTFRISLPLCAAQKDAQCDAGETTGET